MRNFAVAGYFRRNKDEPCRKQTSKNDFTYVVHDEVGSAGSDNREETLDQELQEVSGVLFVISYQQRSRRGLTIQDHPCKPAIPFILDKAADNRPPNAPATVAAEKKTAIRKACSCRRYHMVR